jgi:glucose/arabinose dehydrogenase
MTDLHNRKTAVYINYFLTKFQRIRTQPAVLISSLVFGALLSACSLIPSGGGSPVTRLPETLTLPSQTTQTPTEKATETALPLCTPPPCAADESYFCAEECPGGCGTTCATHTPTANDLPSITETAQQTVNVQQIPNPDDYQWALVASNFSSPVGLAHAGDGSNRLFILEQQGVIRILENGQVLPTPFLDLRSKIGSSGNEQGLLGLAFHPNFVENGLFVINYTDLNGDTIVSRMQVSTDPNLADSSSETLILSVQQPYGNHNGGNLVFGPDGYLYIGLGDGGSAGDPRGNGQNSSTLLGSMLRLDLDTSTPYAIPEDNPFVNGGGLPEIWATGLRNPWRYSFDRLTGDLFIGDVGQGDWEEIHYLPADSPYGANLGWNFWEGLHPYQGNPSENTEFLFPIWEYGHDQGCSVTGGFVYRGTIPAWQGIYFYGDFCSGRVWGLLQDSDNIWQNTLLFKTDLNISSFGEDEAGEIYLVDRSGSIYQLTQQ